MDSMGLAGRRPHAFCGARPGAMRKEIYDDFIVANDLHTFKFISKGKKGNISKQVLFIPDEERGFYNLEFGDVRIDGSIDYLTVSNNGDRDKILATIMRIVDIYTTKYPDRIIYFIGSNTERIRLYSMMIALNLEELSVLFNIYAKENKEFIPFTRNMNSTEFLIKRKT